MVRLRREIGVRFIIGIRWKRLVRFTEPGVRKLLAFALEVVEDAKELWW